MTRQRKAKPIPKHLLIHGVSVEIFLKDTPFGVSLAPIETMTKVRVEPAFKIRRNYDGVDVDIKSIIFIDCVNTPNAKELPPRSTVIWQGREMKVIECGLFYDFDGETPHHYEVLLV